MLDFSWYLYRYFIFLECKKSLTSIKNNSGNINILSDKIETYCDFARLKEVQFLKNETELVQPSKYLIAVDQDYNLYYICEVYIT